MAPEPDKNFRSFADQDGLHVSGLVLNPFKDSGGADPDIDDTLKLSHTTNSVFENCEVYGDDENAIDANRLCENVTVRQSRLIGGDQASIVNKGGCRNMAYEDLALVPSPKAKVDIIWDDWSDQSKGASTGGVVRRVKREDRLPVRIAFGRFVCPKLEDGDYKILWPLTVGMHFYNYCWKGPLRAVGVM